VEAAHIAAAPPQNPAGTPPTLSAAQQARATAKAQAESSGKPVPVDALTDAFSTTVAQPDGSFTLTQSPQAQRVQQNGTWVPLDATLAANADGTLSPKAASGTLSLSAGGSGPVATMTGADGKKLSINAPFTLPAPTWSGATAVYANVAPDVDLDVTANPTGGAMTVLVVKSAAAAANPLVQNLKFTTTSSDLTVTADQGGNLAAADSSGQIQFTAPTPLMWDSSTSSSSATPTPSASAAGTASPSASSSAAGATQALFVKSLAQAALVDSSTAAPADGSATTSSATGPGDGAKTATVPATVSGSTISLTPSQSVLNGTGTQYPVFIDPNWQQDNPWGEHFAWTQSAYPNQNNYDVSNTDYPGVGTCGTYTNGGSCIPNDTEETYYQFDTSLLEGTTIYQATLDTNEHNSADMSCTTQYKVDLDWTGALPDPVTWNSHPGGGQIASNSVGGARQVGCDTDVPMHFDVTPTMKTAEEQQNKPQMTFKLHADDTSNVNGFKRFNHNAQLMVQYDTTPLPPDHLSTTNAGYYKSSTWNPFEYCTNTAVGVDSNWPWINGSGVTLNAAPEGTQSQYHVNFRMWDDSVSSSTDTYDTPANPPWVNTGSQAKSDHIPEGTTASTIQDGHAYGWLATGTDALPGVPASANSQVCHFRVDATAPKITITNTGDFPPSGSGIAPTKYAGDYGTIGISVTDPAPTGYNGTALAAQTSGVQCLNYSWDPAMADARTVCGSAIGTLQIIAPHWGTDILYLQADDYAENFSQIYPYAFYAPWNANGPRPRYGDITGDGVPDALVPGNGTDGNLYAHSLPTTTSTSPTTSLVAAQAYSPHGDPWSNYQITHRGSTRGGMNVDDVIAHKAGDAYLYTYKNPGNSNIDGKLDVPATMDKPTTCNDTDCSLYNGSDWSTTLQVAALGDITSSSLDPSTSTFLNRTGLVTTETINNGTDAALWFYPMVSDTTLGTPHLLSASGWLHKDLISPGDWNGSGRPGLWTRDHDSTGAMNGYTFAVNASGTDTVPPPTPISSPTVYTTPMITAISAGTSIGAALSTAFPFAGSDGDLTDSATIPTLWSVNTSGTVNYWTATNPDGVIDAKTTWSPGPLTLGAQSANPDRWLLQPTPINPTPTVTQDETGLNSATAVTKPGGTGTVTFAPVTDTIGLTKQAATLDGTNTYLTTQYTLDTTKDYTLSAWVDLNPGYNTAGHYNALCLRDATSTRCSAYLQYSSSYGGWAFVSPSSDIANPATYAHAGDNQTPVPGKWTHLAAVFNAANKTMTLYVNGTYQGSGYNPSAWTSNGPMLIGGSDNDGQSTASLPAFPGSIADVSAYPAALTTRQVATLASRSPDATGRFASTLNLETIAGGNLYDNQRNDLGTWTGPQLLDQNGSITQTAITALSDGTMHVQTLVGGKVYDRQRNLDGTWTAPASPDDASSSITAISSNALANGAMHIQTLIGGKVYDNQRNANGSWTGPALLDGTGSITDIASTGLPDGTMHVQTLRGGKVYDTQRNVNGTWTPVGLVEGTGTTTAIASSALPDGTMHVQSLTAGNIDDNQRNTNGTWTGATLQDTSGNSNTLASGGFGAFAS
jgi:hypothetical protein